MRTTLFTTLLFLLGFSGLCQDNWSRKDWKAFADADFAFYQGDYAFAEEVFARLYAQDSTYAQLNFEYGVVLLDYKNDKVKGLNLLKGASDEGIKEAYYHYGRALHKTHQFDEAIEWFDRYLVSGDDKLDLKEVQRHIRISLRAKKAINAPVDVKITNMGPGINTSNKEYVPLVTPDNQKLFFTSRRPTSTAQLKDPNGEYFEDIYAAKKVEDGVWGEVKNLGQPVNSETHDATVSISGDGNTMIIYRTNENLTGGDLYITEFKKGKWNNPVKLPPTINTEYQEASATLSPDKNTLYFSSNRPGGYGGKDLYRVRMLPNGQWSLPKNMGAAINTPYDEDAPHMDIDGKTLYFASQGHSTIGGFDLFRTKELDFDVWATPENLGYPANTVEDDIFLSVDAGGRKGYFSSERPGGFGQQDLYEIDFIYRQQQQLVIVGETRAVNGLPLAGIITVIDEDQKNVQGIYRGNPSTGKFILILNPMTTYKIVIEIDGYKTISDDLIFSFPESKADQEQTLAPYMFQRQ